MDKTKRQKGRPTQITVKTNSFTDIDVVYEKIKEMVGEMEKINPYVDISIEVDLCR